MRICFFTESLTLFTLLQLLDMWLSLGLNLYHNIKPAQEGRKPTHEDPFDAPFPPLLLLYILCGGSQHHISLIPLTVISSLSLVNNHQISWSKLSGLIGSGIFQTLSVKSLALKLLRYFHFSAPCSKQCIPLLCVLSDPV